MDDIEQQELKSSYKTVRM